MWTALVAAVPIYADALLFAIAGSSLLHIGQHVAAGLGIIDPLPPDPYFVENRAASLIQDRWTNYSVRRWRPGIHGAARRELIPSRAGRNRVGWGRISKRLRPGNWDEEIRARNWGRLGADTETREFKRARRVQGRLMRSDAWAQGLTGAF